MRSLGVWEFGSLDNSFKEFGSLDNSFKEFGSLGVWEFRSLGVWTIPFHLEYSSRQANYPFSIVHRLEARGRLGGVFLYVAKLRLIPLSTKSEALCGLSSR